MKIAITTIRPRREYYFRTLFSLQDSGLGPSHTHYECGQGPWKTWFNSLSHLVHKYKDEDYYGIIQDDVIFCKNLDKYLDHIQKPQVFSLFKPQMYVKQEKDTSPWIHTELGGKLWMAQTFFFSRRCALSLLQSKIVHNVSGNKQIDNRVGLWAKSVGVPVSYHSPSLAQHIGQISSMWTNGVAAEQDRSADDFVGEDFNSLNLIKHQ